MADDTKKYISLLIHKLTGVEIDTSAIEIPPKPEMGDYALPCFLLAKGLKKSPADISKDLASKVKPDEIISSVAVMGPYLNFFVRKDSLSRKVLLEIFDKKERYG